MRTYLFAWNPKRWNWEDLDEQLEQVSVAGHADDRWSTGVTKDLPPQSRFFLIRLGEEPKGIMGSGLTLSAPYLGPHWDPNAEAGAQALFADIRFDFLSREILVAWEELQKPPFSPFHWGTQASGIRIPESIADALEAVWRTRIGSATSYRAEIPPSVTLPEGAKRRVTVNAYERNPVARAACIAHHGCRCKVCDVDLGERFGEIAKGFIHVHHVLPLSAIGKRYEVNPINDLVPVCPTCHAILHLSVPPLSVAIARTLLNKDS